MGEKAGCRLLVSPPRSLPLLFFHNPDFQKMAFSSIGDEKYHLIKTSPPHLYSKKIQGYSHGWFILVDKDQKNQHTLIWNLRYQEKKYSLWNPLTLELICLPLLTLNAKQKINFCILSSAPGDLDSMLILFEKHVPSLIFCRIGFGNKEWTHQSVKLKLEKNNFLANAVICNRTLYCCTFSWPKLVKIDLRMPDGRLPLVLLDDSIPDHEQYSDTFSRYMLESCGELFLIYLVARSSFASSLQLASQVVSVEVFRLDSVTMVWNKVESIKNRAFFLSNWSSFSWPVTDSVPEIKDNHVYFTLSVDKCLYSYNMDDKTLSVSLACPNLHISWYSPIWVMPELRESTILRQTKGDLYVKGKKIKPPENGEIVKHAAAEQVEGDFGKLPLDMLLAIGKRLMLHDYMNFWSVNKRFRLEAPPIRWTSAAIEDVAGNNSLHPLLMFCRKGDNICSFIDLWGEQYPMNIPNNQMKNVMMCYSMEGWCLMLEENHSIFLWNPFVKKIIQIPNLPREGFPILGISFSSSIDLVVLIGVTPKSHSAYRNDYIDYIFLEEGQWHSLYCHSCLPVTGCNNFTFYDGAFYTFDYHRRLFVFKETGFKIFEKAKMPCSSRQTYLIECNGKLMSVFVDFLGRWVRIFKLDNSDMAWVEVESIGNYTIYVSHFSSFAIPATHGMENRVYFTRFYGKNALYYSLYSRKLHCHGSEKILESFYNTKELLYSSSIQPKWF